MPDVLATSAVVRAHRATLEAEHSTLEVQVQRDHSNRPAVDPQQAHQRGDCRIPSPRLPGSVLQPLIRLFLIASERDERQNTIRAIRQPILAITRAPPACTRSPAKRLPP